MIKIIHRINTVSQLQDVPRKFGVEIDINAYGNRLVLQHEPMTDGEDLEDWLNAYQHRFIIFNVKTEGLEIPTRELAEKYGIESYFFLDVSFPSLLKLTQLEEKRVAVRVSEYESPETALALKGKAQWIWLDTFTRFPIGQVACRSLKDAGYRLCLVSPELLLRPAEVEIPAMQRFLEERGIVLDAVCTKRPDLW
jgi:hypothetical protein